MDSHIRETPTVIIVGFMRVTNGQFISAPEIALITLAAEYDVGMADMGSLGSALINVFLSLLVRIKYLKESAS
jgi:hypothetical protein